MYTKSGRWRWVTDLGSDQGGLKGDSVLKRPMLQGAEGVHHAVFPLQATCPCVREQGILQNSDSGRFKPQNILHQEYLHTAIASEQKHHWMYLEVLVKHV